MQLRLKAGKSCVGMQEGTPGWLMTPYAAPRPNPSLPRHHQLKGELALASRAGRRMERWQYEVTGGGRIWYLIDEPRRTLWIDYAGPGHPKLTD
ncbi:MAG: hypothetical protein ACREN8_12980 [Candidatus Dormibacteraceae bacterium]